MNCSAELNSACAKVLLRKTLVRLISAVPPCGSQRKDEGETIQPVTGFRQDTLKNLINFFRLVCTPNLFFAIIYMLVRCILSQKDTLS